MDFGMDMTPTMSVPGFSRRGRSEKYRGALKIRTPKVDAKTDKKWFGVPPTPLDTAAQWRPSAAF